MEMHLTVADMPIELQNCPRIRVMDVEYLHVTTADGDDLYLTANGLPFAAQLMPDCFWSDRRWSRANRQRLKGTSTVYRIRTKPAGGRDGKDIVLKWNRMGQDVPGATGADNLATAIFNSPFEEFALTTELRAARIGPQRVYTHKPLAIYVPSEPMAWDRTGRKRHRLEAKRRAHTEIELHFLRNYAVIYEWIKGIDAVEAHGKGLLSGGELDALVEQARDRMLRQGFVVRDNKPHHVIVRPGPAGLARGRDGLPCWAYVDFELLQRAPERERQHRDRKRKVYLHKQAHRFEATADFPAHLHHENILGVDYVYGHIESTDGALWVVGRDPDLFDYFLPEKWRKTPRTKLSVTDRVYETTTKDNVRLVWRVSRVGEQPDMDPFKPDERRILDHGYNSPFEEVSLALALGAGGIGAIYPRAIYATGDAAGIPPRLADLRRYESHARLKTPDGRRVLEEGRHYIIIWGYWNGPDDLLAVRDDPPYTSINALQAYRDGLVDEATYIALMKRASDRLAAVGVEDLNLRGNHLLLSLEASGRLAADPDGLPTVLICNFALLRREDRAILS